MRDQFNTLKSESRAEMKVSGSRFIATAFPASSRTETEVFLAALRKEFWDATHNCFAYRFGTDDTLFRFNDDGEPSGSAGKPILAAIDKHELTDILVVVTRYFGGTKLGVGGLVRAYGGAAELALMKAEPLTKYKTEILSVTFHHSQIGNVMHVVSKVGAKIADTVYDDDVHATLEIRLSKIDELKSALVNQTSGNIVLNQRDTQ